MDMGIGGLDMKSLYTDQRDMFYVANLIGYKPTEDARFLAEMEDQKIRAVGIYDNYNGRSVHSHIWIEPGYRPSRVFWWAMPDYAFMQLAVTNVLATVKSSNKAALKLVKHLGYTFVCEIPDYHETGDAEILFVGTEENATHWHKYRDGRATPPTYSRKQTLVA